MSMRAIVQRLNELAAEINTAELAGHDISCLAAEYDALYVQLQRAG